MLRLLQKQLGNLHAIELNIPIVATVCSVQNHAEMADCPTFLGSSKTNLGQQNVHRDFSLAPGLTAIVGKNHSSTFTNSDKTITCSDNAEQITLFRMIDYNTWLLQHFGQREHICMREIPQTTQQERCRDSSYFFLRHTIHR
ncbi:hypothetical protein D3C76_796670 [compost metagenome]